MPAAANATKRLDVTDPALSYRGSGILSGSATLLTRAQRLRRFGIDCIDGLEWHAGWEPGGEYVKQLVIKNASTKAIQIKYKLPTSTHFSMDFPETISLTAGLSKTLQVVFRPVQLEEYDDCIVFSTDKGSFMVPIRASIPSVSSMVPDHLDFGFCPCQETALKTFSVVNNGEVPVSFSWSFEPPFSLAPRSGKLAPRTSATITARFSPTDACVYVATCVCTVPEHRTHTMKIGGIGKYPFIAASAEKVDFGQVLTSTAATRMLKLSNRSLVYARFSVERRESDVPAVFGFAPSSGIIPPDGEQDITVRYCPQVSGTHTHDWYDVRTTGGNTIALECAGEAAGPAVSLSKHFVNFNDVSIELPRKTSSRQLELVNHSNIAVPYLLHGCEPNGIFAIEGVSGVIPPLLSVVLKLSFAPTEPGNYYKRVFVLLLNQSPLPLHLIGSGYDEKRRPATLTPKHVNDYLAREQQNLHLLSPEELQAYNERRVGDAEADATTAVAVAAASTEHALMSALFRGSSSATSPVAIDEERLDFGQGSRLRVAEGRSVRVLNRTGARMSVSWAVPASYAQAGPRDRGGAVFAVSPSTADVPPFSSTSFKVQFRPQAEQQYYCQWLECVASFKTLRTFRLATEENFSPPWTLALCASGHTFSPNAEQFIPRAVLSHESLCFPAAHVGDSAFQTVSLRNDGDTPIMFSATGDATGVFKLTPKAGVVPKGGVALLALCFTPTKLGRFERVIDIVLNNDSIAPKQMRLVGIGCRAKLDLANGGNLLLSTTCVGSVSRATMRVKNPWRLSLAYEWDVAERHSSVISVDPPSGVLRGHEEIEFTWAFKPQAERQYAFKVPCLVTALDDGGGDGHEVVKQVASISGVGSKGTLTAEPSNLDFGSVLVGDEKTLPLSILNSSAVDLYYSLSFNQLEGDSAIDEHKPLVRCTKPTGVVPARNTVNLYVMCSAQKRGQLRFETLCRLRAGAAPGLDANGLIPADDDGASADSSASPPLRLGEVAVDAAYPLLQVVDARLAGHAQEKLWSELQISELNTELGSQLTDMERKLNSAQGLQGGGDVGSITSMLNAAHLSLPAALLGAPEQELHLLFANTGGLHAKWTLRYPTEMELTIEHWADVGEPTAEELKQHMMVDEGVFSVYPKRGELAPGETVRVTVRMRHFRADEYELPLLFKIFNGKQMVLNLRGRTLAHGEAFLHMPVRTLTLGPAPIGLPEPQINTLELPNYGDVHLLYELDLSAVDELNSANFAFPVISCAEPCGSIPPNGVARVAIAFHPLQSREYSVGVPIIVGGDGAMHGSKRMLLLKATAAHPSDGAAFDAHEAAESALLPPSQQMLLPNQPLRLSFDRALFGRVPMGANVKQMLILQNVSEAACGFEWDTAHPLWGTRVSIYPSRGSVPAGKHVCCKLTFLGAGPPEKVQLSIGCTLSPEAVADSGGNGGSNGGGGGSSATGSPHAPRNGTHRHSRGASASPEAPARLSVTAPRPKLRGIAALQAAEERRQKLAAMSMHDGSLEARLSAQRLDETSGAGSTEEEVRPQVLYLDVRGTVLPSDLLEQQEGFDVASFYIPHSAPSAEEAAICASPLPSPTRSMRPQPAKPVLVEQRDACEALLSDMIRELLTSTDVRRVLTSAEMEEVPWFAQLRADAEGGDGGGASGGKRAGDGAAQCVVEPDAPLGDDATLEQVQLDAQRREEKRYAVVKASTEMQELAAYVLEGTLFNLVSEASHGEFNLLHAPRQVVRSANARAARE